jgi:hypothetical protein
MSRFLVVKTAPENLQEHEFVIGKPDFYEQINKSKTKKPKSSQMTVNYLREVIASIGQKYIGQDFDTLLSINVSKFIGVPCDTDKEVHDILIKAFEEQCPSILFSYIQHCFKQRPSRTNIIYYTWNPKYAGKFVEYGWEQISLKDLEDERSGKQKKIVGKPAITSEQATALSTKNN